PTRQLLPSPAGPTEEEHLRALEQAAHRQQGTECLAELHRQAAVPDADPETLWQQLQGFCANYPELSATREIEPLVDRIKARGEEYRNRRAQHAYDDLIRAEQHKLDLEMLLAQADQFLRDYSGSPLEAVVRQRRDAYLRRLDERAIEAARDYSARRPLNF